MSNDHTASGLTGSDPLEAAAAEASAREFYDAEGLDLPPLPCALAALLVQLNEVKWGIVVARTPSNDDTDEQKSETRDLTDLGGFLDRATDSTTPDDVAFGYTGHGVSSWWMCYQLILGPLALFIRRSYGGPYEDAERARRDVNQAFNDAEALIISINAAAGRGRLARGQRLIVAVDDRNKPFWGLSDRPEHWQESQDPCAAAESFLKS